MTRPTTSGVQRKEEKKEKRKERRKKEDADKKEADARKRVSAFFWHEQSQKTDTRTAGRRADFQVIYYSAKEEFCAIIKAKKQKSRIFLTCSF